MAVEITIGDSAVTDKVSGYSITEESTSLDVTDMRGGVGQMSLEVADSRDVRHSRFRTLELVDDDQGKTTGKVSSITVDGFKATVTADSRLVALVATRSAEPYSGTLAGLLTYYLSLAGVTSGIVIDSSLASVSVTVPGWRGVVLDAIKSLCAVHRIELSLVSNNVVLRPARERLAQNHRNSQWSMSIDDSQLAQSIIVHYLHSATQKTDLAYPVGGWNEDVQIFNVKAGETLEFSVDLAPRSGDEGLGVSLTSITQPVCVDFVSSDATASVYCVAGNDGKPITASQWLATGGNLEVEIGEDSQTLLIRVTGASMEKFAPYRIAATSGSGNFYSSLRVRGNGIFYDRRKLTMFTGNDEDTAPTEVGAEVDIPFLRGYEAAWRAAADALCSWTGPTLQLAVTTRGINRAGDTGSAAYPTIDDFNALYPTEDFDQFNALWPTEDLDELNSYLFSLVENAFENQAFGNIAGARVDAESFFARIRSATVSPAQITYRADNDTTITDWNEHYGADLNFDEFNDLVGSEWTVGDLGVEPLLDPALLPAPPPALYPNTFYPDEGHYPSRSE